MPQMWKVDNRKTICRSASDPTRDNVCRGFLGVQLPIARGSESFFSFFSSRKERRRCFIWAGEGGGGRGFNMRPELLFRG